MNAAAVKADFIANIPECLQWNFKDVADWVEEIGFPQYKECFLSNFINGRKLLTVTCASLPNMGVTDYKHIMKITEKLRELLKIAQVDTCKYVSFCDAHLLYLQQKTKTGYTYDHMTFTGFKHKYSRLFKD
ncbi:hypothetical protein SNE40_010753 [Patella caerulea]|uniref:SAM domain-containing protein n=1 Tax=Patella caerulea TaxID=87958 RepID=A0AAN8K1M2_PATCE